MIAILHTWRQNLSLHPHLHCIVPGGGIDQNGKWKKKVRTDKYLFCVKAMSKVFRAKFVAPLRVSGIKNQDLIDQLFTKNWVVYAKRPFGGPKQIIEYLGIYTHKVATCRQVSNHRIKEVTDKEVRFGYKDYRKEGQKKEMKLRTRLNSDLRNKIKFDPNGNLQIRILINSLQISKMVTLSENQ